MASFVKFNVFVADIGLEKHQLNTDTLKVYLSNEAPVVASDAAYRAAGGADTGPEEIANGNGYTAGGEDVTNTWSQTGGVATLAIGADVVWTAAGGTIGPFRYAVLYNDTDAGKVLIGYWDYGSAITLQIGETFTFDMTTSLWTLT